MCRVAEGGASRATETLAVSFLIPISVCAGHAVALLLVAAHYELTITVPLQPYAVKPCFVGIAIRGEENQRRRNGAYVGSLRAEGASRRGHGDQEGLFFWSGVFENEAFEFMAVFGEPRDESGQIGGLEVFCAVGPYRAIDFRSIRCATRGLERQAEIKFLGLLCQEA